MNWLRNSPFRSSFSRQSSCTFDVTGEYDANACYQSFCKHWQQAYDIIGKSQPWSNSMHDDVLGVVSHLEHLATLLYLEARNGNSSHQQQLPSPHPPSGACLEYLLSENLLDKLYEWGITTGRYLNVVRLEQLKIYTLLTSNYGSQLLGAEPFLRPLLKLLASCQSELLPVDVEDNLVTLLVQLCVILTQNIKFVELFFLTTPNDNPKSESNFLLVSLLLPLVHREGGEYEGRPSCVASGGVGGRARNALLLCATLSARCLPLATALADSNLCPVLATGLSGLYSILPRQLDIVRPDWHRLTPDDINDIDKLTLFMNSLEFCNAVAQVAHPIIKQQLLDFLFQGFLVPVMGPALLQAGRRIAEGSALTAAALQSGAAERIAAAAYAELAVRSATERGLLRTLLRFLLLYRYDGVGVLRVLLNRIHTDTTLCLATLALMETLIDLNCEDVMLELVFKYLSDGSHLMVSHRKPIPGDDPVCKTSGMFLSLTPECCLRFPPNSSNYYHKSSNNNNNVKTDPMGAESLNPSKIHYGLHSNETLYNNYHAYLCEARRRIRSCLEACQEWSCNFDGQYKTNPEGNALITVDNELIQSLIRDFQSEHTNLCGQNDSKASTVTIDSSFNSCGKEHDSLQSISESSGYESFKYRPDCDDDATPDGEMVLPDDEHSEEFAEESFWKTELAPRIDFDDGFMDTLGNDVNPAHCDIGPLLQTLFDKLKTMLDNDLFINIRLTGVISRLAVYPSPLLRSLLLCPWIVLQPTVSSLFQIISIIKQQIDSVTKNHADVADLMEEARTFLIDREISLANARRNAIMEIGNNNIDRRNANQESTISESPAHLGYSGGSLSPGTQLFSPPSQEIFRRNESKRKSFSTSFSSMFRNRLNSSGIVTNPNQPSSNVAHSPSHEMSPSKSASHSDAAYWQSSKIRRAVINAIILEEWLKELAALAQEHAVACLDGNFSEIAVNRLNSL